MNDQTWMIFIVFSLLPFQAWWKARPFQVPIRSYLFGDIWAQGG